MSANCRSARATPLHVETEEETFYVLAGEVFLHIDGKEFPGTPGTIAEIPRGVPHAFVVTSETAPPARPFYARRPDRRGILPGCRGTCRRPHTAAGRSWSRPRESAGGGATFGANGSRPATVQAAAGRARALSAEKPMVSLAGASGSSDETRSSRCSADDKAVIYSNVAVLGGELAVPCTRNPLQRG